MRASKGFRRRTRDRLKKTLRHKFKPENYMKEFKIDEKVIIKQDPSSQKGMPHPRFLGKPGRIIGKRGQSYIVNISVGNSQKEVIARPEHLKRV